MASVLPTLLPTLLLFLLLLAAWRFALRPALVVAVFIAAPALLAANAGRLDLQVFTWVKVITLSVSMMLIVGHAVARSAAWQRGLAWSVTGIVLLNILEAVVADALAGHWANAAVGVSLMATLPGPAAFSQGRAGRPQMLCDIPWRWTLCYTAWNLTVVCGIYPLHWTDHFAVLSVPLVAALVGGRGCWLEARAFSLALYAVGVVLAIDLFGWPWLPPSPSPAPLLPWLSGLAVLLALWNLAPRLRRWRGRGLAT